MVYSMDEAPGAIAVWREVRPARNLFQISHVREKAYSEKSV
jgi:hypothetical protein